MKDLEKIKSEDLAAQVQDANPANFAIEQEVAKLVGATVPQPTQPSADDARELGAQLLVFLRRALTPIQSALRTAVAAIYAHLDSRCTAYTPAAYDPFRLPAGPYDPMRPFVPRTLPNLLTALTAFDSRKISDLGDCPDGISFAQIIGGTSGITTITDDNDGWTLNTSRCLNYIKSIIPSLQTITMNCVKHTTDYVGYELSGLTPYFPKLKECGGLCYGMTFGDYELPDLEVGGTVFYRCSFNKLSLPNATHLYQQAFLAYSDAKELYFPKVTKLGVSGSWSGYYLMVASTQAQWDRLEKLVYGPLHEVILWSSDGIVTSSANLIHLEFGQGVDVSLNLSKWNPTNVLADADKTATFLQNFREHIALRLTSNGSGLTLTLSQAVRDAIHAAEATYGIEAIIVTQKGWTLSPAPGASSQ